MNFFLNRKKFFHFTFDDFGTVKTVDEEILFGDDFIFLSPLYKISE